MTALNVIYSHCVCVVFRAASSNAFRYHFMADFVQNSIISLALIQAIRAVCLLKRRKYLICSLPINGSHDRKFIPTQTLVLNSRIAMALGSLDLHKFLLSSTFLKVLILYARRKAVQITKGI